MSCEVLQAKMSVRILLRLEVFMVVLSVVVPICGLSLPLFVYVKRWGKK